MLTRHNHDHIHRSGRIGAFLAIACAIHCALTPIAITILPLAGLSFLSSHWAEFIMLGLGIGFGGYGVAKGYFSHGDRRPIILVVFGAILIVCGLFLVGESLEPLFVPAGAILLGAAQVVNMRISKPCDHEHPEPSTAILANPAQQ
jgi:hypothetical protein